MDIIGEYATGLFSNLRPFLDWAIGNWAITMLVLGMLIYGAGNKDDTVSAIPSSVSYPLISWLCSGEAENAAILCIRIAARCSA